MKIEQDKDVKIEQDKDVGDRRIYKEEEEEVSFNAASRCLAITLCTKLKYKSLQFKRHID